LIQTSDVLTRLGAMFGIKGKTPSPTLGDQVHPVAIVGDLSTVAFNEETAERRAGSRSNTAALAANLTTSTLFNPTGSGLVIRVDRIGFTVTAASGVALNFANSDPGLAANGSFFLDRRISGSPGNAGLEAGNVPAGSARPVTLFQTAGDYIIVEPQIFLPEGRGVSVETTVVNVGLVAWMWWTEAAKV